MTLYDLIYLFTEDYQELSIYDLNSGEEVFRGTISDMNESNENYSDLEIMSIDTIENNILTINVEL